VVRTPACHAGGRGAPAIFLLRGFRESPAGERNPNSLSRLFEEFISRVNRVTYETLEYGLDDTAPFFLEISPKIPTISGKSDPSARCNPKCGVSAFLLRATIESRNRNARSVTSHST
jgi:hypothetical protein